MMDEAASWRRQESGRSRTQVGWLALNGETPHALGPRAGDGMLLAAARPEGEAAWELRFPT